MRDGVRVLGHGRKKAGARKVIIHDRDDPNVDLVISLKVRAFHTYKHYVVRRLVYMTYHPLETTSPHPWRSETSTPSRTPGHAWAGKTSTSHATDATRTSYCSHTCRTSWAHSRHTAHTADATRTTGATPIRRHWHIDRVSHHRRSHTPGSERVRMFFCGRSHDERHDLGVGPQNGQHIVHEIKTNCVW